jgi:hypothetical protein
MLWHSSPLKEHTLDAWEASASLRRRFRSIGQFRGSCLAYLAGDIELRKPPSGMSDEWDWEFGRPDLEELDFFRWLRGQRE